MTLIEARHRLRTLFSSVDGTLPTREVDQRLRQEIATIFKNTPKPQQMQLLEGLSQEFPVWPADVPPPSPEEMIERLRMRMDSSEDERRRVEFLLRQKGIGCGLSGEEERKIRDKIAVDPEVRVETGRVVESFLSMFNVMAEMDNVVRRFLQENGLGMMMVGVPRLRDSLIKLLTTADDDSARHARLGELENACKQLGRAVSLLSHWPHRFAEEATLKISPANIKAAVPPKRFGNNDSSYWKEYITRIGGREDDGSVKAELLEWMAKVMQETVK